jgi:hypothetical protein
MANIRSLQRSFSGGELTPDFFGRIDDVKYQSGMATCRNFIVKPHGPIENRPGFAFVREVKNSAKKTRLIPFTFSTTQTLVIEMGEGYFRFHTQGGTVLSSGFPVEVANPYAEADLFDIHYVQSNDVLTLVHPNYPPYELRRLGPTSWSFNFVSFTPPTPLLAAPTLTKSGGGDPTASPPVAPEQKYDYCYVVTAVGADGISESVASPQATTKANLFETGQIITISWSAVGGATRYFVYKLQGGLFGYIGQTTSLSIIDDNIAPDLGKTPPQYDSAFASAGNYPGAVSYFEQRRCFAGTINSPQNIWMTKSGTENNLSFSLPLKDDDRINFRVAAREANTIRHIVPLSQLLLLTSSAEWRVTSINSDAITPTTISVRPQSYVGASNVQPVVINNTLIYGSARGGHVRELAYNWQANGFLTGDLSLRAPHLFDNLEVTDMAYAKAPIPLVWFVSSNGKLLGLTYVPEQQVGAWHQHDTDGAFESIAVVAEGNEDVLYAVVRRTINGQSKRYVERMQSRQFANQNDAFFVDCGATYSGVPTTSISGLTWLEGKTVSILADGAVHPQRVVTGGAITLDNEASKVHIGLPITADMRTLPVALGLQDGSFGQGRVKNINKIWLRVFLSSGIFAGPDFDALVEAKQRTTEPYGSPPVLKSEEIPIMTTADWNDSGQLAVRQSDPLPLTVVSVTMELSVGG